MQPDALQEHVERVIPAWCAENGFGLDPVTVTTFTELAVRLLAALLNGLAQEEDMPSGRSGPYLSDPDCPTATAAEGFDTKSLPSPYIKGEDLGVESKWLLEKADSMAYGQSPSTKSSPDVSGHWRTLFYDEEWWAVGHNTMYPAKDEDDARRLCNELGSRN